MPAYVIVEINITNPDKYEEVKSRTPATVKAYGGKYLARGGRSERLAGNWSPERLVILEFESTDRVKEWLDSPEYLPVKKIRDQSAEVSMVVVEGSSQSGI